MENQGHSEDSLRVSLAELRGHLEGINVRIALQGKMSAQDRQSLREELEAFKTSISTKVEDLQKEVAKLMGKWAVTAMIVGALITLGISDMYIKEMRPVDAIPPKVEHTYTLPEREENDERLD